MTIFFISSLIVAFFASMFCIAYVQNFTSYIFWGLCVCVLAIPVLNFVPQTSDDLTRYYGIMTYISSVDNFKDAYLIFKNDPSLKYQESSMLFNMLEFIVSKTSNFRLLPFFNIAFSYFCFGLPFIFKRNKKKVSNLNMIIGILATSSLITYFALATTLRWGISAAMFFLITFVLYNTNKRKQILWYFIPLKLHVGTILPIAVIIYSKLIKRIRWFHILIFMIIMGLIFKYYIFSSSAQVISDNVSIANRASMYTNDFIQSNTNGVLARIIRDIIPILYMVGFIFAAKKVNLDRSIFYTLIIFIIVLIFLVPFVLMFDRYSIYLGLVPLVLFLTNDKFEDAMNLFPVKMFVILGIMLAILENVILLSKMIFVF